MPENTPEEQVADKAREHGYWLIPHGGEYVLADLACLSWSAYGTLAEVEQDLADLD